ncbi:Activator of basal transcription 1 [Allomyces arbusculus]|nr:Activator of basal transcription 1 [Allomyces arbusculus]
MAKRSSRKSSPKSTSAAPSSASAASPKAAPATAAAALPASPRSAPQHGHENGADLVPVTKDSRFSMDDRFKAVDDRFNLATLGLEADHVDSEDDADENGDQSHDESADDGADIGADSDDASDDEDAAASGEDGDEDLDADDDAVSASDAGSASGADDDALRRKKPAAKKILSEKDLSDFKAKTDRTGLVYMSRVPRFMPPDVVRKLLSQYADIGRIYLALEDAKSAHKRKKYTGNGRKNYVEGWIEFLDKREAKAVAKALNNELIGGRKLSKWHDSIWNLKYLPKFKWHHLTEQIAYEKRQREQRLRNEIMQAKRENKVYLDNVAKGKMVSAMEAKKAKRKRADDEADATAAAAAASAAADLATAKSHANAIKANAGDAAASEMNNIRRRFKQRKVVHDVEESGASEDLSKVKGVLSKIFG